MTALDEARDRLLSGTQSWESLRAEGRAWEDRLASRAARARPARGLVRPREPASSAVVDEALVEREQSWRLWRGGSALVRSEYSTGDETVTVVLQGPRWWRSSPSLGSTSGGESRAASLLIGPANALVDASRLADNLELVEAAAVRFLGRDAYVVRARPRGAGVGARASLAELGRGADEFQIVVDEERGVVLSLVALTSGRPFKRVETTVVAFDEAMRPQLFTPDEGEKAQASPIRGSRRLSLGDLVASVSFTVVVPEPAPSDATPHVAVLPPTRRGAGPPWAAITYPLPGTGGARGNLRLELSSQARPSRSNEEWRQVGECEVFDQCVGGRPRPRVRSQSSGTYVELESSVLSSEELVRIARSLVPLRLG